MDGKLIKINPLNNQQVMIFNAGAIMMGEMPIVPKYLEDSEFDLRPKQMIPILLCLKLFGMPTVLFCYN